MRRDASSYPLKAVSHSPLERCEVCFSIYWKLSPGETRSDQEVYVVRMQFLPIGAVAGPEPCPKALRPVDRIGLFAVRLLGAWGLQDLINSD